MSSPNDDAADDVVPMSAFDSQDEKKPATSSPPATPTPPPPPQQQQEQPEDVDATTAAATAAPAESAPPRTPQSNREDSGAEYPTEDPVPNGTTDSNPPPPAAAAAAATEETGTSEAPDHQPADDEAAPARAIAAVADAPGVADKTSTTSDPNTAETHPVAAGKAAPSPIMRSTSDSLEKPSATPDTDTTEATIAKAPASGDAAAPPPSAPAAPPGPPIPDIIVFRKSPDGDDFGFRAVLEVVTNPQIFSWTRFAFRLVAFVSFPMFTIAIHPNTMFALGFPQMLIASVIASSTCRPTLGEQIGLHSWTWRGVTFMLILGTVFDAWNLSKHVGAWWGMIALSIFLASLCTHGGMRRFMYLYIFVYLMELRMFELYFGGVPINNAAWLAADMYMATFFGIAALLFPYPILTSKLTDMILAKIFEGMGKMLMGMQGFVVAPTVHAAVAFYSDASPFQKIEHVLALMAPLLWFTNWEPWEFPTRNPVRRLKLSLLRRIMALTYAAFSIGQEVVSLRRDLADRVEMQKIRMEIWLQAHAEESSNGKKDSSSATSEDEQAEMREKVMRGAETSERKFFTKMKETYGEERATEADAKLKALRANTNEYYKVFTATLMQTVTLVGKTKNKPENLVKEIPFQTLAEKEVEFQRNRRLEVLQMLNLQSHLVAARRQRREKEEHKQKQAQQQQPSSRRGTVGNASLSGNMSMTRYAMEKQDAMEILDYQDIIDDMDVYLAFQEMFFAMLLSMIAGELISFGEMMADYKPEKSLCRRLVEFYFIEPWFDFWSAAWSLLHLDTPSDIRTIKDAIKMTSAFLAACAFNFEIWIPQGGMYFFGTTILLGLPVEEETLGIGVCRMAGNTLGCALGYLAYHNTKNLSEMIGLIMSLSFVCHLARNHPVFGQCFFYAAFIAMAGMATSLNTLELLVRVLASTYTVMAYTLCCIFVFPTNPIKILWGYRMKMSKAISETIDDVAVTARLPLLSEANRRTSGNPYGLGATSEDEPEDGEEALLAMTMRSVGQNANGVDHMLAELNVQLNLVDRLLAMCTKWTPFAEAYPIMRGTLPYPKIASLQVHGAHLKMVASLRLLVFGVQLIHRPRAAAADPALKRLFSGSVADFLDDFAGAVRLIFQNFVDSLQASRTWSYPASLMFHGVLMKLRVRLRAILFETFVLIGIPAGRNMLRMDEHDLESLQRDTSLRMMADLGVGIGDDATPQGGAAPPSPSHTNNSFAADPNASFAGRYLLARRAMDEYQQQQQNARGNNPLAGSTEPTPRTMEDVRNSEALNHTMNNLSMSVARGGSASGNYQHRARFTEAAAEPQDMFPFRQEDPRHELNASLRHAKEKEEHGPDSPSAVHGSKQGSKSSSRMASRRPSAREDDTTHQPDYHAEDEQFPPVGPTKTPSKLAATVSRLVQPHAEPDKAALVPKYQGPGFSYREDALDLPVDTDFLALVAILSSCGTFMDEVQSLSGPVNNISSYQKQLHESSLCLSLLDKLSDCTKATRKENYERYHYPPPPPEKRAHVNAQVDMWRQWRF